MERVQENLLKILSGALWDRISDQTFSESEWIDILDLAEEQGVLFLILQGCTCVRRQLSSPEWLNWRSKLVSTMVYNDSLMGLQSKLLSLMAETGIACAVLKGTSIAACYYDPVVRALGDIDLLVAPQYVDQAVALLLAQGFSAPEESFSHPYHIDFYKNNAVVELHFAASSYPDSAAGAEAKRIMESCWQDIRDKQVSGHSFPCLSDVHQALSLLLHMQRHMTTGCIGLRQLCDWAVFLKSVPQENFRERILPKLQSCGLAEFAAVLTMTAARYLKLEPEYASWCQRVRESSIRAMIDEILREGSIHHKNKTDDSSSFFVEASGTESALRVFIGKINALARSKYPVTQKLPFLLPLFWIYIPTRYWVRSLAGKRRRKSLLRTIKMTKQRKQLYQELRLFQVEKKRTR